MVLDQEKNALLNSINNQSDFNKIHLYANEPYEAKYQYLKNVKKYAQSIMIILKFSLNIQMIWKIFIKILKNEFYE